MELSKGFRIKAPQYQWESHEEWAERNGEWQYEEAVVKHLISRLQLPSELGVELWKEHKRDDPDDFGRLTLPAFCMETRFPVWLGSRRFKGDRQLPLAKFLRQFTLTPMYEALVAIRRATPDGFEWFGLVFPVAGAKFMALHTFESELEPGTTRMVIPRKRGGVIVLEPLSRLLDAVGARDSWQSCSCEQKGVPE